MFFDNEYLLFGGFFLILILFVVYLISKEEQPIKTEDLEEIYAKELADKQAIVIKANVSRHYNAMVVFLQSIAIVAVFIGILLPLSFFLDDCNFNENFTLRLFIKKDIGVWMVIMYCFAFVKSMFLLKRARKTGWDGDIQKKTHKDEIIFKLTKKIEKRYIFNIRFSIVMIIFFLLINLNWQIIMESSSFAEANRLAHQQCMADKNQSMSSLNSH